MPKGIKGSRPTCSVDGCESSARAHGFCSAHNARFQRYGDPLGRPTPRNRVPTIDLIMAKVDQSGPPAKHRPDLGPCWTWTGGTIGRGYGVIRIDHRLWLVYKWLWESEHGPVPDGLELDHFACDNGPKGCVNPGHVKPVTHAENMRRSDAPSGVHARQTECIYGHPFSAANTRMYRGQRVCKACVKRRNAARYK